MCSRLLIFICVLSLSLILRVGEGVGKEEGIRVTREMIYEKLIEIEKRQAVFEALVKNIVSEPPENFFQIFLQISL